MPSYLNAYGPHLASSSPPFEGGSCGISIIHCICTWSLSPDCQQTHTRCSSPRQVFVLSDPAWQFTSVWGEEEGSAWRWRLWLSCVLKGLDAGLWLTQQSTHSARRPNTKQAIALEARESETSNHLDILCCWCSSLKNSVGLGQTLCLSLTTLMAVSYPDSVGGCPKSPCLQASEFQKNRPSLKMVPY
jgi:hypothetical protein